LKVWCSNPAGPSETPAVIIRHLGHRGRWIGKSSGPGLFQLAKSAKLAPNFYIRPVADPKFLKTSSPAVITRSTDIRARREGPAAGGSTGPSALRPTRRTSAASSNRIGADNVPEYGGHKKPQDVRNPEAPAIFALNCFGVPSHVIVCGPPLWRRPQTRAKVPCLKSSTSARSG
jgi:hypothetical protein